LIQEAIRKVVAGVSLSPQEAEMAMAEIMDGRATPAQIAGLAVALRMKGETASEVKGFATAMRRRALRVKPKCRIVADTCGTGGDGKGTLNISTGAAFVAAGAGVVIAKHGNRAASSRCGSADVLEALGIKIDPPRERVERCLNEVGIAFLFAPLFHPAMRHAGPPRRELGIRTIFNILGPITNPAGANVQLLGVGDRGLMELLAESISLLGTRRTLIVHSHDGLDELAPTAVTRVIEVTGGKVGRPSSMSPRAFGFRRSRVKDLAGGNARENADELLRVLKGKAGAFRDAVVYGGGAVCWLAGRARGMGEGIAMAAASIDSGAALDKLERLKDASHGSLKN